MSRGPRVIGAGWGRTGTASLKRALERLGFGPCHHMEEVIKHPADVATWERAAHGEQIDWRTFMEPWGSCCDFPSAMYYRELMQAFPDAKVVLTVRDAESWYRSMSETIVPMLRRFPNRFVMPHLPYLGGPSRSMSGSPMQRIVLDQFDDRARMLAAFQGHIDEVKRVVPTDKLLVFEVREGWAPLCAFLDVPVPDEPFPRVNDTAEFQKRVRAATAISWAALLLPAALIALLLRRRGGRARGGQA
jgi:hypothetical protein